MLGERQTIDHKTVMSTHGCLQSLHVVGVQSDGRHRLRQMSVAFGTYEVFHPTTHDLRATRNVFQVIQRSKRLNMLLFLINKHISKRNIYFKYVVNHFKTSHIKCLI